MRSSYYAEVELLAVVGLVGVVEVVENPVYKPFFLTVLSVAALSAMTLPVCDRVSAAVSGSAKSTVSANDKACFFIVPASVTDGMKVSVDKFYVVNPQSVSRRADICASVA